MLTHSIVLPFAANRELNSILMIVQLKNRKADKILQFCLYFSPEGKAFTLREVASLIGSLISSCPGVEYGRLHYRSIERDKIIALKASKGNFEIKMLLSGESREELQWWIQNVKLAYRNLQHSPQNVVICTDASAIGWGAKLEGGMRHRGYG